MNKYRVEGGRRIVEPIVQTCSYCQKFTACREYEGFWFCVSKCWDKRHRLTCQVRKNAQS